MREAGMARGGKMKVSNLVVWVLLGLLIIGLAGFGIGDFGGSVRSVGKVGRTEISTQDYARALQNQLAALQQQTGQSFGMAQARSFGIDRMVLERLPGARRIVRPRGLCLHARPAGPAPGRIRGAGARRTGAQPAAGRRRGGPRSLACLRGNPGRLACRGAAARLGAARRGHA
ncbi:MAG: hypothetical protein CVT80_11860 [Alphaproteobacteria bacterium HGW-Alphaproteobacteria-2]|nr:MAG: hypothetical protein CVT80_11860 [Alphaproteobacteria bacterium HGW-Alphaproteobacteria-2]